MIPLDMLRDHLAHEKPLRRKIGKTGRINIDRQLPFLCLYRQPEHNDWGTRRLVQSEASHLILPRDLPRDQGHALLLTIVETLSQAFGAFLIIDIQAPVTPEDAEGISGELRSPSFIIRADRKDEAEPTIAVLEAECGKIVIQRKRADVSARYQRGFLDKRLAPLMTAREAQRHGCHIVGLDVTPIYRDTDNRYPLVLRALRRGLSRALKRTAYDFGRERTLRRPPNYLALGKQAFAKAVFVVDKALAEINNSFDFLLQCTPTNVDQAWHLFKKRGYDREPRFTYRPLPFDPALVKRRLFQVPIERIEDPTLEHLLSEKQQELDYKLTLMRQIGTKQFRYGSMQLFDTVDPSLRATAEEILARLPQASPPQRKMIGARVFARMASREVARYQEKSPAFAPPIEIRDDLYAGLLVSRGSLLIGKEFSISRKRARALINHEVGTHLLTYHNGEAQPFHQLQIGLAGYDELQEGLSVLSEYLAGGFSRDRLRILAGRVIAIDDMIRGAGIVDIYRVLNGTYNFSEKMAFQIAMRACRGGGLTKDAVYLRGLLKILNYVRSGGDLEILYVGKIGTEHIPLIKELKWRKVITPMKLVPRVLTDKRSRERLAKLRSSTGLQPLIAARGEEI